MSGTSPWKVARCFPASVRSSSSSCPKAAGDPRGTHGGSWKRQLTFRRSQTKRVMTRPPFSTFFTTVKSFTNSFTTRT